MEPELVIRFLVTAFFAVVFLQSGLDKLIDRNGNEEFLRSHFGSTPLAGQVPLLLTAITLLELAAGTLCALGLLLLDFRHRGAGIAASGLALSGLALVGLMAGQRMAKDYAGAAVLAAYFAVVLIGLSAF